MQIQKYLMEGDEESVRLDLKTDDKEVKDQALWAGIRPGMRVADIGCGAGKTTFYLNQLVQPGGETVGVDFAEKRIQYAKTHYSAAGIEYVLKDIQGPVRDLGMFDFIWIRFVLEYYRLNSFEIVKNVCKILKPGGIICLIDLDCNPLRHYGHSQRLENILIKIAKIMEEKFNFDPYAGIRLYSYLYDLGYQEIDVKFASHNLIFGELAYKDEFNWMKKVEVAAKNSGYKFEEYEDGFEGFVAEFKAFFSDCRRLTYTPMISCRGRKPV